MTSRLLLMAVALTLLSGATARAGLFDDEEARRQIADVRKRVDDVGRHIDSRIAALEATIKSQGLLDMFNAVEGIKSDIAGLRGQIEVLHNDVESTQKRQRDLYVDLDTRMRKMETVQQQQAAAAAAAAVAAANQAAAAAVPSTGNVVPATSGGAPQDVSASMAPSPVAAGVAPSVASASPSIAARPPGLAVEVGVEQRAYDAALDQFKSGNYSASLQSFVNFVRTHPRSALAPSAQYWVGNAHYALRDYRSAIASQRQLVAVHPDSQKVPDALLNISSSQIELGDTLGARRTLEDLALRYPASEAADRAKKRLAGSR